MDINKFLKDIIGLDFKNTIFPRNYLLREVDGGGIMTADFNVNRITVVTKNGIIVNAFIS